MQHQAARLRRREEREVSKGELCAGSELASRLEAKQLAGAHGGALAYRMAGRLVKDSRRSDALGSRWRDAVPPVA